MVEQNDYKELMTEIIKKQKAVLGPDIAVARAQRIPGLKVDAEGRVLGISGEEQEVLQKLVDQYIELSGQIVKNVLDPVFKKYPSIKIDIK